MFHMKDGLHFARTTEKPPRIVISLERQNDVPLYITATEEEFASVIASVSARGESRETWDEALQYLRKAPAIECHGLDTPERVRFYEHDFYVLSNFSAFCLHWRKYTHFTSEHAYHWARFDLPEGKGLLLQDCVQRAGSAHEAFKFAQENKHAQREDWDAIKVATMREILRVKADQHEYVRRKLLQTGDRELVEDSWRDSFWGWGPNLDGQNMLGKLWMQIRAELRNSTAPKESA